MKNNWFLISLIAGISAGLLSFLIVKSWKVNLIIGVVVLIIMLINNPVRRYMRAFFVIIGLFLAMHRFSFEFIGSKAGIDFQFGSNQMHWVVSVGLLVLAIVCLVLDQIERGARSCNSLFQIKKNSARNISGSNVNIHQSIDENKK
jgi:hypothetical protein